MANKYLKRFSASLVIRGKPMKPTMIQHFIPIRLAKMITSEDTQCEGEVREEATPRNHLSARGNYPRPHPWTGAPQTLAHKCTRPLPGDGNKSGDPIRHHQGNGEAHGGSLRTRGPRPQPEFNGLDLHRTT